MFAVLLDGVVRAHLVVRICVFFHCLFLFRILFLCMLKVLTVHRSQQRYFRRNYTKDPDKLKCNKTINFHINRNWHWLSNDCSDSVSWLWYSWNEWHQQNWMLMIECLMFTVQCSYMSIVDFRLPNTSRAVDILIFFHSNVIFGCYFCSLFLSLSLLSAAVKQLCVVISNQISEYFGNNFNISEDKAAESLSIISKVKRKRIGINSYLCYSSCAKAAIHLHDPVLFAKKGIILSVVFSVCVFFYCFRYFWIERHNIKFSVKSE